VKNILNDINPQSDLMWPEEHWFPRLSLVSPKVYFLHSVTDGVPCHCRLWLE